MERRNDVLSRRDAISETQFVFEAVFCWFIAKISRFLFGFFNAESFTTWISAHGRIFISASNSVREFHHTTVYSTLLFPWAIFASYPMILID